jgi:O-antigen/teichoic acid export membrane protein
MNNRLPPELDMTPDGHFRAPAGTPLGSRVLRTAIIVGVASAALAASFLMLWFALALIPVALIAGLVAWVAFRIQVWRMRRGRAVMPRPSMWTMRF